MKRSTKNFKKWKTSKSFANLLSEIHKDKAKTHINRICNGPLWKDIILKNKWKVILKINKISKFQKGCNIKAARFINYQSKNKVFYLSQASIKTMMKLRKAQNLPYFLLLIHQKEIG